MQPNQSSNLDYKNLLLSAVKDKYPYILLGATVLLIILLFLTGITERNKMYQSKTTQENSTQAPAQIQSKKYVVQKGDTLWSIAEITYGSGFNYPDIAAANKLANPSVIEIGQELILPVTSVKPATVGELTTDQTSSQTSPIALSGNSYTVKEGDFLWQIATQAYGDGFAWVKIAQANNLVNPSLIHPGNILKLPRR